jgi:predicted Zn finger-like uncharacterized protein
MAAADTTHVITCPSCKARFAVVASMAGRRARCAACSTPFTVPAPGDTAQDPPLAPAEKPAPAKPQFISVECRVCGTRLTGRAENVGKKIKCPDCGAGTVIPEPPAPKQKNMPAALDGEQYELWDTDDQPLPSDLIAAQPRLIAITCRKCASLMHASEAQVGSQIECPDCGMKHIVPPPTKKVVRPSVLTPDSHTPQIDPTSVLASRPPIIPHMLGLSIAEQEREAELQRAMEESRRTGRPMKYDERGRAVLPRFPLLTGILQFPFSSGCPSRWVALTVGLLIWSGLLLDGVLHWANWNNHNGDTQAAFAGLVETLMGGAIVVIWFASVSSVFIAIVAESAVGTDRVDDWPSLNFIHSLSEMLPLGVAIMFSAAPGWIIGKLTGVDTGIAAMMAGGSLVLLLPLVALSQQAGTSTWELIDLGVLGAMVRCPFSMLLFYIQSACLLALCAVAAYFAWQVNVYLPLLTAPLIIGCILIYARLMGRLGWRLSEKITVDELDEEEERPAGPRNFNPPRQPRAIT